MYNKPALRGKASAVLLRFCDQFLRKTPWFVSPVSVPCEPCAKYNPRNRPSTDCEHYHKLENACAPKTREDAETLPVFKEHDEASSIQLFYDLFFVANLSACTNNHPIEDKASLSSYVGFFTLLWFTWFSTIIFDVRFAIDSWFTRLSKACSFGIMTAFAMSSVFYDTADKAHFGHDAPMISLILMVSRLVLVVQYGVIMVASYQRHRDKSVLMPFALTMCTSLVAALVFLGLYRLFQSDSSGKYSYAYFGWYITSVTEAAVVLVISYSSDLMKFDTTNIVERMGALTLIIMGDGIIAMTESVSFMLKTQCEIPASTAVLVIAAVLIIYVLWMLYFDHADKLDHPGGRINKHKPWCQIWAFLHFPLHIALVLTLKGSARFVLWWNANGVIIFLMDNFNTYWNFYPYDNGTQLLQTLQEQLANISDTNSALGAEIQKADFQSKIMDLQKLGPFNDSSANGNNAWDIMYSMENTLLNRTCDLFDINLSKFPRMLSNSTAANSEQVSSNISQIYEAFRDWYIVFFVAAGCVLILLALARYVGHQSPLPRSKGMTKPHVSGRKHKVPWVAITIQCLIGTGLAFISLLGQWEYSNAFFNFIHSQWIIPTVLLAFCLVMICDNFLFYLSTDMLSSDILHPPVSDGSPADQKIKTYHGEIKRLRAMLIDRGADPMRGSLLEGAYGRSKSLDDPIGFRTDTKSPFLHPSSPPHRREVDRMSNATDYSGATEMPLLNPSLSPNAQESDVISAQAEYWRYPGDAEEGYEA